MFKFESFKPSLFLCKMCATSTYLFPKDTIEPYKKNDAQKYNNIYNILII